MRKKNTHTTIKRCFRCLERENATAFNQTWAPVATGDLIYDPWGANLEKTLDNNYATKYAAFLLGSNRYKYNDKESITSTRLYDYGARQYDPVIGRWMQVDPLAEKYYDLSLYNYVANNPIKYIDIKGDSLSNPAAWLQLGAGVLGVFGSGAYMYFTGGVGAAAGGSVGMAFSFGEVALGIKELRNKNPNYTSPTTLLGASVEGDGGTEEQIAAADAVGGLIPGAFTGGNLKGLIGAGKTVFGNASTGEKIYNAAGLVDGLMDISAPFGLMNNQMRDNPRKGEKYYNSLNPNYEVSPIMRLLTSPTAGNKSIVTPNVSNKQINSIRTFLNGI